MSTNTNTNTITITISETAQRLAALRAELRRQDEASAAEIAAVKNRQRGELVREWGDASQRARHTEGLLPATERDALIRDHVLAPITAPAYQPIVWLDCRSLRCDKTDARELTASQYARLVEVRAMATKAAEAVWGDATVRVLVHTCRCADGGACSDEASRVGAVVRITFGALSVSREYALD